MLAAIALILCTVVLFKMKRERYAWVTALPAIWLIVCTMTAGWSKIFNADAKIGFLAHAAKFSSAMDEGKVLAPAKDMTQMQRIVFNDTLDATLAAAFVVLVLTMLGFGLAAIWKAYESDKVTARETLALPAAE